VRRLALVLVAAAGCGGLGDDPPVDLFTSVPEQPTYVDHIAPLMRFYCDDCHGSGGTGEPEPSLTGSGDFVSDVYDSTGTGTYEGVYDARFRIRRRAIDLEPSPMPPPGLTRMGPVDAAVYERWLEHDAPLELK
jgi:hypothetical protein